MVQRVVETDRQFAAFRFHDLVRLQAVNDSANHIALGPKLSDHFSQFSLVVTSISDGHQRLLDFLQRHFGGVVGFVVAILGSVRVDDSQTGILGQRLHVFLILMEWPRQIPDVLVAHDHVLTEPGTSPGSVVRSYLEASPIRATPAVCLMLVAVLSQLVPVASSASVGDLPPVVVSQV
ncbi:hypothetical protein D3C84_650170 [compost metagenome]